VANGNIVNFTKEKKRRVDWVISLRHGVDYVKAHTVLERYLQEDKRVLKDPEPFIALGTLTASSVDITVRAWAKTDDYWPVHFDLNKRVYEEFESEGLHLALTEDARKAKSLDLQPPAK
jgi:small conductance mechanosensitive channel